MRLGPWVVSQSGFPRERIPSLGVSRHQGPHAAPSLLLSLSLFVCVSVSVVPARDNTEWLLLPFASSCLEWIKG